MKNTGIEAAIIVKTDNRLASSLPKTSSRSRKSVINSNTSVRRSFSCATLPTADSSEKAITSESWTTEKT